MKRARIVGVLALGLTGATLVETGVYSRASGSFHAFQQNMAELKTSGTRLSSLERIVYSLMLTTVSSGPSNETPGTARARRT